MQSTIVILGGGFGGVYTLRALARRLKHRDARIILIDRENYFLFSPLVHEVATGGVNRESVATPLRDITRRVRHAELLQAAVLSVDFAGRRVETSAGSVAYDTLVVALGAESNFYGVPGAGEHALPLKFLEDAVRIKNRILDIFEEANRRNTDAKRQPLTVVIIGGGPTGVELAAELGELVHRDLKRALPALDFSRVRLVLVEGMDDILGGFHPKMRQRARTALERHHIEIRCSSPVAEITPAEVRLRDGSCIPATLTIWTAGVKPVAVRFNPEPPRVRGGRLDVLPTLQLARFPNVFAVGDIAFPQSQQLPPPMTAQVARAEAEIAARNIIALMEGRTPERFAYTPRGMLVSLGSMMAGAELKYFKFFGRAAWIIWRTFYITRVLGLRNRVKVAVDWFFNLFSSRDISRV